MSAYVDYQDREQVANFLYACADLLNNEGELDTAEELENLASYLGIHGLRGR